VALRSEPLRLNGGQTSGASDETLAAQVVALADTAAFETLMRRHQQRIFYLLNRFSRDPGVAEELCQETFLRAWRKLASFEGRGPFGGWLTRLAYNVFLQHQRRRRHQPDARSLEEPAMASAADEAAATPGPTGSEPDLERLLAAVSAAEQRLLVLTYAEGLSATEIGAMLGVSPGTVKSQIHRAKNKIRLQFQIETTS
jgi:RNA polymerase sigma-70 factor (ECF subfamily)